MAVREALLALLRQGPRHGYQLKTEFEAATGDVWRLNVGQVYTTLERLVRDGLVDVDETGEQKTYRLTRAGVDALGEWWRTVPAEEPPPRDELMLKVLMAIDAGSDHALDVISRQRDALRAVVQRRRQSSTADRASALMTDALALRAEADIRWLDLCASRVV